MFKTLLGIIGVGLAAACTSASAQSYDQRPKASPAPSFDCAKSTGAIETTICHETRLASLDTLMDQNYREAIRATPTDQKQVLKASQVEWLRQRTKICTASPNIAACLDGYYRNRIDQLKEEQEILAEAAKHGPPPATYQGLIGRWRVIGVDVSADAGEVTAAGTNDPMYMGLELSVTSASVHWLNGSKDNQAWDVCQGPALAPVHPAQPLHYGWKAAEITCRSGTWESDHERLILKSADRFQLEREDDILLTLVRVPDNTPISPSPKPMWMPPLGPNETISVTAKDKAFFLALRSAVDRGDRAWLAHLPCGIPVNREPGASYTYKSNEVADAYDRIITPKIKRAIDDQDPNQIFKRDIGAMVGNGEVWFSEVALGGPWVYCVTAINQGH